VESFLILEIFAGIADGQMPSEADWFNDSQKLEH